MNICRNVCTCASVIAACAAGAGAQQFSTLYVSGDAVPSPGGTAAFNFGYDAGISDDGYITFKADLATGTSADQGIFFGQVGSVAAVAFEGENAPGTGFTYETFNAFTDVGPAILSKNNGYMGYAAQLSNRPDPMNVGIWSNATGSNQKISLYDDPDPGSPSDTLNAFSAPYISDTGQTMFYSAGSAGSGIFVDPDGDGNFSRAAFSGDVVAGLNSGETIRDFSLPSMNRNGQWIDVVSLNGSSDRAIIFGDMNNGQVGIALREGAAINNSSQTVGSFNDIGDNQLVNANGTIAFGHFGSSFAGGIVVGNFATGLRTVGERGQEIGDTGLFFNSELLAKPKLNNNDEVSFVGRIQGASSSSDRAIFVTDSDLNASIFLREGDSVPGLTGVTFGQPFNNSGSGPDHLFNDNGIVVAGIGLAGNVSGSSNYAIVYGTSASDLQILVREGDLFNVNGEDLTISGISYTDELGIDGSAIAFNSNNEFIFRLDFTNGTSGLFVATIPAPASGALAVAGLGMIARRRRH